jgi:enoyl-CoA hydratase/carnithine racemase
MFTQVLYECRENAAYVVLNRPERRNALSHQLVAELRQALELAARQTAVRALVIAGSGGCFCAGADLHEVLAAMAKPDREDMAFLPALLELLTGLRRLPKPVIAAVDGVCAAGGLELVLCCDLIIASERARFSDAHARYGLLPGMGGAAGLARAVGPFRAKEMMFLAGFHDAHELARAGLVNRVVAVDELDREVGRIVEQLAERSPRGLRRMKEMLNRGIDMTWEDAARLEFADLREAWRSGEFDQGVRAFVEGRAPRFSAPHEPSGYVDGG